jgi:hypothetical protein
MTWVRTESFSGGSTIKPANCFIYYDSADATFTTWMWVVSPSGATGIARTRAACESAGRAAMEAYSGPDPKTDVDLAKTLEQAKKDQATRPPLPDEQQYVNPAPTPAPTPTPQPDPYPIPDPWGDGNDGGDSWGGGGTIDDPSKPKALSYADMWGFKTDTWTTSFAYTAPSQTDQLGAWGSYYGQSWGTASYTTDTPGRSLWGSITGFFSRLLGRFESSVVMR